MVLMCDSEANSAAFNSSTDFSVAEDICIQIQHITAKIGSKFMNDMLKSVSWKEAPGSAVAWSGQRGNWGHRERPAKLSSKWPTVEQMPRWELCLDDMQRVQSTELEKEYVVKVREGDAQHG